MALLNIFKIQTDSDFLRKKSKPVEAFDENLRQLINDMKETLIQNIGAGLAAPQVGVLKRVFIADIGGELFEFINPVILRSGKEKIGEEGCLSVPGEFGKVKRPRELTVEYYDMYGMKKAKNLEGIPAVIVCHETDHLDGIIFTDKLAATDIRTETPEARIERINKRKQEKSAAQNKQEE